MELSKRKQGIYAQLRSRKFREKYGLFIVEGRKSVEDMLGYFEMVGIVRLREGADFHVCDLDVPVYEVSAQEMDRISSLSSRPDVLAVCRLPENLNQVPEPADDELYLLLDGIQDPGNLGTIVRTCHWFGIHRIYASKLTADIYNPKAIQSAMGSLGHIEIVYCDLEELVKRNPQMPVWGTLLDGENIYEAPLEERGFIVMGNEGNGISEGMRKLISNPLLIPPYRESDHAESLNVAIATAVTLSQFRSRLG